MKDARLSLRVGLDLLNIIKKLSAEYNITVSGFISMILTDALINSKVSDKLKREIQIYIQKIKRKETCNRLYIIKNMYRRVMDMAMSYFFTTGNINMKAINTVIDGFVAEFKSYDALLQEKIKVDFNITVKRLRDKDFLFTHSKNMKMMKYIESK